MLQINTQIDTCIVLLSCNILLSWKFIPTYECVAIISCEIINQIFTLFQYNLNSYQRLVTTDITRSKSHPNQI